MRVTKRQVARKEFSMLVKRKVREVEYGAPPEWKEILVVAFNRGEAESRVRALGCRIKSGSVKTVERAPFELSAQSTSKHWRVSRTGMSSLPLKLKRR